MKPRWTESEHIRLIAKLTDEVERLRAEQARTIAEGHDGSCLAFKADVLREVERLREALRSIYLADTLGDAWRIVTAALAQPTEGMRTPLWPKREGAANVALDDEDRCPECGWPDPWQNGEDPTCRNPWHGDEYNAQPTEGQGRE